MGEPTHCHNLTLFPLVWPQPHEPPFLLLSKAIEAGEAVVEEVSEAGSVPNLAVTNRASRPLLIPEGEILVAAKQNRVIDVTVLLAAGVKFTVPVSCVKAGRGRYQSQQLTARYGAPPSLRSKSSQERLQQYRERFHLPEGAAGILVGRCEKIVGMDLFDSPETFKTLWPRLSDAYFFDVLREDSPAPPTCQGCAQRFIDRVSGAARPRTPALALGDELKISGDGFVGAALLYDGGLCHLAAFCDQE
jgi:hypothetical protein